MVLKEHEQEIQEQNQPVNSNVSIITKPVEKRTHSLKHLKQFSIMLTLMCVVKVPNERPNVRSQAGSRSNLYCRPQPPFRTLRPLQHLRPPHARYRLARIIGNVEYKKTAK